jgi:hypothetical protein
LKLGLSLVPCALLALVVSLPAFAQRYEVGPYFSLDHPTRVPLGTVRATGGSSNDTQFRNGKGVGLRFTLNTKGYYGHEITYARSQVNLQSNVDEILIDDDNNISLGNPVVRHEKIKQSRLGYNFLMYMMPAGEKWRPYITVGVATINHSSPLFLEWTGGASRNYGANWGGGIKLFPHKNFLVRFDARHYWMGRPYTLNYPTSAVPGNVNQLEFSGGVSFAFGKN